MNFFNRLRIKQYHRWHTAEHGAGTVEALGWRHNEDQLARFAMLALIGDMNGCSVLDAGCGYGDLRGYLGNIYPRVKYTGIDQIGSFLATAIKRNADLPDTKFYKANFCTDNLPPADYVLACGSLNYYSSDRDFIYKTIGKLFGACHIALGFNLLSKIEGPPGILVAYDPDVIVQYCRSLTVSVILRQDYFEGDFTIFMYRQAIDIKYALP
jgi:SAM-dependent methyltransferase